MAEPSDHVIVGDLPADLDEEGLKTNFEAYGTIKWCKLYAGKGGKGGAKSAIIEFASVEEASWLVENLNGNVPLGLDKEVTVKFKPPSKSNAWADGAASGKGAKGAIPAAGKGKGKTERITPYSAPAKGGRIAGGKNGGGKGDWSDPWGGAGISGEPSTVSDLWKGLLRHKILPGGTWANDEKTVCVSGLPADTTDFDLMKIFSPFGAIAPGGVRVKLNEDGTAAGSGMINFLNKESTEAAIATLNNCMLPDGRFLRLRQFDGAGGGGEGKGGGKWRKGRGKAAAPVAAAAEEDAE